MKKVSNLYLFILGGIFIACTALVTPQVQPLLARFLTLAHGAEPSGEVVAGTSIIWVNSQGVPQIKTGTTNTAIGSGSGSGSGSGVIVSTVWPPENIQNPQVGMFATGPVASGYASADSMYQQAQYMGPAQGWNKYVVSRKKVPFL